MQKIDLLSVNIDFNPRDSYRPRPLSGTSAQSVPPNSGPGSSTARGQHAPEVM